MTDCAGIERLRGELLYVTLGTGFVTGEFQHQSLITRCRRNADLRYCGIGGAFVTRGAIQIFCLICSEDFDRACVRFMREF